MPSETRRRNSTTQQKFFPIALSTPLTPKMRCKFLWASPLSPNSKGGTSKGRSHQQHVKFSRNIIAIPLGDPDQDRDKVQQLDDLFTSLSTTIFCNFSNTFSNSC